MKSLGEITLQIEKLANQIDVPPGVMPSFGNSAGQAYAFVYIEGNKYHWVIGGNSTSPSDTETLDLSELLYLVFQSLTDQMGLVYEILHRNQAQDYRRIAYRHQLELLEKLNPEWKSRREKDIVESLKWYPYEDKG